MSYYCTFAPRGRGILNGNFWEKSASYGTYNTICYEVRTFNVGDSLKFVPYNVQSYWQKAINGLCVHCSPWNKFDKKTTTTLNKLQETMGILCTKADLIHLSVYTLWFH